MHNTYIPYTYNNHTTYVEDYFQGLVQYRANNSHKINHSLWLHASLYNICLHVLFVLKYTKLAMTHPMFSTYRSTNTIHPYYNIGILHVTPACWLLVAILFTLLAHPKLIFHLHLLTLSYLIFYLGHFTYFSTDWKSPVFSYFLQFSC